MAARLAGGDPVMSYASDRDDWDTASELGFPGLIPDASATVYSDTQGASSSKEIIMAPRASRLAPRVVPSTEWTRYELIDGRAVLKARGGVFIEANQDTSCFSIRSLEENGDQDLIHFCDWPELLHTIARFMEDRTQEGMSDD